LAAAAVFAVLMSAQPVSAQAPPAAQGCKTYPLDGGCSTRDRYVLSSKGAQLQAAHIYSPNPYQFAWDSAQSGQLPKTASESPTSATDPTFIRNAHMHADGMNRPFIDPWYPIGSSRDETLIPMDQYVDPTGSCHYSASPAPFGLGDLGQPSIVCRVPPGAKDINVYIQGVDMTRIGAEPSGSEAGQIIAVGILGANPRVHLIIQNVKLCACTAAAHAAAIQIKMINLKASTGTPWQSVELRNVYVDGQYRRRSSDKTGVVVGVQDDRAGLAPSPSNPVPVQIPLRITNSLFYDLGHDVAIGGGYTGSFSFVNSWGFGVCESANCHGEIAELHTNGGDNVFVPDTEYVNWGYYAPASYEALDLTAPVYTSGTPNGVSYTNFKVQHGLQVINNARCKNVGHVFNPKNPCMGGAPAGGSALITVDAPEIVNFTAQYNMSDNTGAFYCTTNSTGALNGASIRDTVLTIPAGQPAVGGKLGYWPGSSLYDASGRLRFTRTKIVGYGPPPGGANNFAVFAGKVGAHDERTTTLVTEHTESLVAGALVVNINGQPVGIVTASQTGATFVLAYRAGFQIPPANAVSYFQSPNPTATCVPGSQPGTGNPGCGTYSLADKEPTLSVNDVGKSIVVFTTFDKVVTTDDAGKPANYAFGGPWSGADPGLRAYEVGAIRNPGHHGCG
jgi:hypothetical protein